MAKRQILGNQEYQALAALSYDFVPNKTDMLRLVLSATEEIAVIFPRVMRVSHI
jgi:hypothetical protein